MTIYFDEELRLKQIWHSVFTKLYNEAIEIYGSSDSTIFLEAKDAMDNLDPNVQHDFLDNFLSHTVTSDGVFHLTGNVNEKIASFISFSFFVSPIAWQWLLGIFNAGTTAADGGSKRKQIKDMENTQHEDMVGNKCTDKEFWDRYKKSPEDAMECVGDKPPSDNGTSGSDNTPGSTIPQGDRIPGMFDPLILDLNHNGQIDTTNINSGSAYFDIDGNDGGIRERMGWVGEGDGFLVQDKNGNGKIDGIGELFGNTTTNAFDDLRARIDSNGDGVINSHGGLI